MYTFTTTALTLAIPCRCIPKQERSLPQQILPRLVLILRDGNRYEEGTDNQNASKKTFSQLNYKQLQVNIPLEDFKMKRTNEELFKGHGEMLNVWQIDSVVDSTKRIFKKAHR